MTIATHQPYQSQLFDRTTVIICMVKPKHDEKVPALRFLRITQQQNINFIHFRYVILKLTIVFEDICLEYHTNFKQFTRGGTVILKLTALI